MTLSSDLGWAYAAQMKGVLFRALPGVRVVDLTHDLPRHAIAQAAFLLRAMATTFPPRSVHVAVVDPGVGGRRWPIAIRCRDGSVLVGPDNGLLSPLARVLGRPTAYRLDRARLRTSERVGTTFDGRDLFAPAAARIAAGEPLASLGTRAPFRELALPSAHRVRLGASGVVVHIDHFGNLISNVLTAWVSEGVRRATLSVGGRRPLGVPWRDSYEAFGRGQLGLLGSSFGTVEVAVARGSAARRLRVRVGATVRLEWRGGAVATETVNSGRRLRPRRP